jgi:hypothetical protein
MLTVREASTALYGAFRLARLDAGGLSFFDASVDGFWRSFYAALLVAPLYLLLVLVRYVTEFGEASSVRYVLVESIAYAISWLAFPVLMDVVSGFLGRRERYIRYIVAYNWAAVLQNALYLPIVIFGITGAIPQGAASTLAVVALALIFAYIWFITRSALAVPGPTAAGIVVADFLLSVLIQATADRLL